MAVAAIYGEIRADAGFKIHVRFLRTVVAVERCGVIGEAAEVAGIREESEKISLHTAD